MYHGKCVLVCVVFGVFGNLQIIKPIVTLVCYVEKCIQHRQIDGFSESARACEQIDSETVGIEDVLDESRFVDIVHIVFTEFRE